MRALFLIISLMLASLTQAQSLDEYLKEAALNNPSLKAKYLGYEASLQKVPQVGGLPDPTLDFGFFASPVETRVGPQRANIRAMQMFPWFGTLGAQKDAATEMAKAKYELFINSRNELFFEVQEVYYKVYAMDAAIRLTEENIRILKSYERLALSRFENNQGGMIDVLRVQLETGELETQLINMRENRKPMVSKFNTLLSRNADAPLPMLSEMELRELAVDESALIDSITSQNPTLKGLEHQKQASISQLLAAKRNSAPSFGVGLSYTVVDKRTDMVVPDNGKDVWMPMLSIKLPIYRKRYKGQIQEQELLSQMYTQEYQDRENQLDTKLQAALSDMADAKNRLSLYTQQTSIANQVLQILVDAYSTAGKDFEEILRTQRLLLKYELETAKALSDQNTAVARIEALY